MPERAVTKWYSDFLAKDILRNQKKAPATPEPPPETPPGELPLEPGIHTVGTTQYEVVVNKDGSRSIRVLRKLSPRPAEEAGPGLLEPGGAIGEALGGVLGKAGEWLQYAQNIPARDEASRRLQESARRVLGLFPQITPEQEAAAWTALQVTPLMGGGGGLMFGGIKKVGAARIPGKKPAPKAAKPLPGQAPIVTAGSQEGSPERIRYLEDLLERRRRVAPQEIPSLEREIAKQKAIAARIPAPGQAPLAEAVPPAAKIPTLREMIISKTYPGAPEGIRITHFPTRATTQPGKFALFSQTENHYYGTLKDTFEEAVVAANRQNIRMYGGVPLAAAAPKPKVKVARAPRKLPSVEAISDFDPVTQTVVRRGNRTFIVDKTGQRADTEVVSDVLMPQFEANLRALTPEQRIRMEQTIRSTPNLSQEGKAERLAILAEMKQAAPPAARPPALARPPIPTETAADYAAMSSEELLRRWNATGDTLIASPIAAELRARGVNPMDSLTSPIIPGVRARVIGATPTRAKPSGTLPEQVEAYKAVRPALSPAPVAAEGVVPPSPTAPQPQAAGVPPGAATAEGAISPGAGMPPTVTGAPPPKSPLGRIEAMWKEPLGRPPLRERLSDFYLKAQEYLNDTFYGFRRLQTRAAKVAPIEAGGSRDLITQITNAPGAPNAGIARFKLTIAEMQNIYPGMAVDDANTLLWAKHAQEVLAQKGIKRVVSGGLTSQELDVALTQLQGRLGADAYSQLEAAADVVLNTYKAQRQRMIGRFITAEEAALWEAQYPWYNPMRYLDYVLEEAAKGKSVRPLTQTGRGVYRLSDVGSLKAAQRPLDAFADQLIRNEVLFQKDVTKEMMVNLLLEQGVPGTKKVTAIRPVAQVEGEPIFRPAWEDPPGTLSFWKDAKRQIYEVPEWAYREAVLLNKVSANPIVSLTGALNGISRASYTTFSVPFTIANMFNDMLAALVRGGVLPNQTVRRLALSFRSLSDDPIMQAFELVGAKQARFYGQDAAEIARAAKASGGKVIGKGVDLKKEIVDAIPNLGQKGEQASRQAIFEQELNKTLLNWRNMTGEEIAATPQGRAAGARSVEGTINFGRGGYVFKSANPFVIFINANMEGMKLPFRALRESARAKWILAGLSGGMAGLTAYNMSYPEYFDVPDRVRRGSIMIMLPSSKTDLKGNPVPRYLTIIPNTREWAFFFGPVTYAMEKAFTDSPEDFWNFARVMVPQVTPASTVPLPQVLEEGVEQAANYDFYTGAPIVSQGKTGLPLTEQTGPYVSPTVERVAQAAGLSPLRVQHALQSIFGGAGQSVLSVLDMAVGVKNKQGLELKTRYEAMPVAKRATWQASLSAGERSALNAAMSQAQQTIPIVSPVVGRFYHERGGQLERTDWDRFNKVVQDTNKQFADVTKVNQLGIRLGSVGNSIDLEPGTRGGSIILTPAQRADYQRIMGEVVIPGIRELLPTLDPTLSIEDQKMWIQRRMGVLKSQAKAQFLTAHPELQAQRLGQPSAPGTVGLSNEEFLERLRQMQQAVPVGAR